MVKFLFGEADPESPELKLELPSIRISFRPERHGLTDRISSEVAKSSTFLRKLRDPEENEQQSWLKVRGLRTRLTNLSLLNAQESLKNIQCIIHTSYDAFVEWIRGPESKS